MKREVEILVEIHEKKKKALQKLHELKFLGNKKTLDTYYYDPKRNELKPDPSGQLKQCLRIRDKDGESSIAYKVDRFDKKGVWLYSDEYETKVDDYKKIDEIFKKLGFKELIRIKNIKSTFTSKSYEIVLEDVKGLGLFMEVERHHVRRTENVSNVKKEILNWIQSLGIKVSLELTMGKPELMLRKKNKKDTD
ncbi:hypothetical protein A3G63_01320 [Candidatus Kaiserbacteria bacterium RIFCSPLOWO2_12_FULL_52_8]|uniref:CYTH domain-containing protein n=1 Tax=Candidatus Kaiserbacteria bacterium RIFCSPHIGHO2_01_FULL_53_31 TaxID=1798481 RepID=A0A1F6CIE7_9BACT|nr:MAG: hypothetical protein A2678_02395 [Candidatus Kaiserbacteria bacterium RIFCSPHIGHO2_01_FULL_53_31]OGG94356.1 MAG: hypothetical protein A3G63_01320 [Candidatus Kaiserbacteria bacterium RIFCSPLOWO2_12_FULL_52_8]